MVFIKYKNSIFLTGKSGNYFWRQTVISIVAEQTEDDRKKQGLDDTECRLWHVVFTLHLAIKKTDKHTDVIFYELDILPRDGFSYRVKRTKLKAVVSAGDYFEPVITIMLPEED